MAVRDVTPTKELRLPNGRVLSYQPSDVVTRIVDYGDDRDHEVSVIVDPTTGKDVEIPNPPSAVYPPW